MLPPSPERHVHLTYGSDGEPNRGRLAGEREGRCGRHVVPSRLATRELAGLPRPFRFLKLSCRRLGREIDSACRPCARELLFVVTVCRFLCCLFVCSCVGCVCGLRTGSVRADPGCARAYRLRVAWGRYVCLRLGATRAMRMSWERKWMWCLDYDRPPQL